MLVRSRPWLSAYRIYLITIFFESLCSTMVFTVSGVFLVTDARLNPLQLVLVGTVLEASVFLFEVPTGVVADVYSRRLSVIIGMVLVGVGLALYGAFPLFATVLLAQVVWGIGYTFTSGAHEAWIADEIGEARAAHAYLRAAQAAYCGNFLAIPLSVALATQRLSLPMVLGGLGTIGLAGFLVLFMPERGFRPAPREGRSSWRSMGHTFAGGVRTVRRRTVLVTILVIAVIFGAYSEAYDRLREAHFLRSLTFPGVGGWDPVVWFGIMSAVGLLLSIGTTEAVRRRLNTTSQTATVRVLLLVNTLLIVSVIAFGLATSFGVALVAVWAGGALRRLNAPLTIAWLNQGLDPAVRATVFSMRGQADAFGQIAGGPLLGLVATLVSIRASLVIAAAVLALTLPLYARTLRRGDPAAGPQSPVPLVADAARE